MSEYDNPDQFAAHISRTLRDNPHWLSYAVSGLTSGMERALAKDREHHAQVELALQCALMLASPRRINADAIKLAQSYILKALPLEGASPAEREAYIRYYESVHGKPPMAGE